MNLLFNMNDFQYTPFILKSTHNSNNLHNETSGETKKSNEKWWNKLYFLEKKSNMIMDGFFTKITYSNEYMTMNGLYFDLPIKNPNINKIHTNLYLLQIDNENKPIMQILCEIEKQLLLYYYHYYNIHGKSFSYNLKSQLQNGFIKIYKETNDCFISKKSINPSFFYIKISGIWESQTEIGITFKIIEYKKNI